jgi:hypothetical protein
MTYGKKPASVSEPYTFSEVVERACEQLLDRQIKYSIRRIQVMDERLAGLEKELDAFLSHRNRKK